MRNRPQHLRRCMLFFYLLVAILSASTVSAQEPEPSSPTAAQKSSNADSQPGDLPVSLDHIRSGLKQQATNSILKRIVTPPDSRISILDQQRIDDKLSQLDFSHLKAPAAPRGLYGYDQQQRLFIPADHPFSQLYAAFSGRELITIAIENLTGR